MAAAGAVAAVICNSSLEAWATDAEDSDSSLDETSLGRTDFGTCLQCKSKNDNPLFRYCERCFQVRYCFEVTLDLHESVGICITRCLCTITVLCLLTHLKRVLHAQVGTSCKLLTNKS